MTLSRVRSIAVLGALVLAAVVVVWMALARDRQTHARGSGCPVDAVVVDVHMPTNQQTKINVYDATGKDYLASNVAEELKERKFQAKFGGPDPGKKPFDGIVEIRYGPKTVGAAQLMMAYFLVDPKNKGLKGTFDIKRTDDTVDVVVGPKFLQLGTTTEVNQKIAALGEPTAPEGTCAAL